MERRLFCIVNPVAGSGRAKDAFFKARAYLLENGVSCEAAFSEYHGHAAELAREALVRGEREIVAVGGDGTCQEVGSALKGSDASGSVGSPMTFARSLPVPKGSAPITASVPESAEATSLIVPSPPTATMRRSPLS